MRMVRPVLQSIKNKANPPEEESPPEQAAPPVQAAPPEQVAPPVQAAPSRLADPLVLPPVGQQGVSPLSCTASICATESNTSELPADHDVSLENVSWSQRKDEDLKEILSWLEVRGDRPTWEEISPRSKELKFW